MVEQPDGSGAGVRQDKEPAGLVDSVLDRIAIDSDLPLPEQLSQVQGACEDPEDRTIRRSANRYGDRHHVPVGRLAAKRE